MNGSELMDLGFCIGLGFAFGATIFLLMLYLVYTLVNDIFQLIKMVLERLNWWPKKSTRVGKRKCDGCAFFGLWENQAGDKVIGCRIIRKYVDPVIYRNSPNFVFTDCPINGHGLKNEREAEK